MIVLLWYYRSKGDRLGPITTEQLLNKIGEGEVRPSELVWRAGFDDWVPAQSAPGLLVPPEIDEQARQRALDSDTAPKDPATGADSPDDGQHSNESRDTPSDRTAKSRNYFARHWHGQLSLAKSFWVNNILVNLGFGLAEAAASSSGLYQDFQADTALSFTGILVFLASIIAVATWQIVGLWRSAANHISSTGRIAWGRTTQVLVVLWLISAGITIGEAVAPVWKMSQYAYHWGEGEYELRVTSGGELIEISGGIAMGLTDDVRALLESGDYIWAIRLNSHGGIMAEARKLNQLIEDNYLVTYTSTECLSACTVAFVGGAERYLYEGARLGFHRPYSVFGDEFEIDDELEIQKDRQIFLEAGVSDDFVDTMFVTEPESMWYPTIAELIDSYVIHGIADEEDFASSSLIEDSADADVGPEEEFIAELKDIRMYKVLIGVEPGVEGQFVSLVRRLLDQGASADRIKADVYELSRSIGEEYIPKYAAYSSSESMVEFSRYFSEVLDHLIAYGDDSCYRWMFGGVLPHQQDRLTQKQQSDGLGLTANLLESGVRQEASPPPTDVGEAYLEQLLELVEANHGPDAYEGLILAYTGATTNVERLKVCEGSAAMYKEALRLAEPKRSDTLRYLFSQAE